MDKIIDWNDLQGDLLDRLGFCGCGMPDAALILIYDLLNYVELFRNKHYTGPLQGAEWDDYCDADKAALQKVIDDNSTGVKYCLFYLIDNRGITNHGGSVPGCIEDYEFIGKLKTYIDYLNRND